MELTLSELQEMATRQQQHIEAQQQMLVAKVTSQYSRCVCVRVIGSFMETGRDPGQSSRAVAWEENTFPSDEPLSFWKWPLIHRKWDH